MSDVDIGGVTAIVSNDGASTGRISRKQRKQHHTSLPALAVSNSSSGSDRKSADSNTTRNSRPFSAYDSTSTSGGLHVANDGDLSGMGQERNRSRSVSLKRTISDSLSALSGGRRKSKLQASTGDLSTTQV